MANEWESSCEDTVRNAMNISTAPIRNPHVFNIHRKVIPNKSPIAISMRRIEILRDEFDRTADSSAIAQTLKQYFINYNGARD